MNQSKHLYISMKKIYFKKIRFINLSKKDFPKIIKKSGLFVFPSGPGLATINNNKEYLKSLRNSDYVFFDSGYFVLLLKILKNINVEKFSGYLFLELLFKQFKKNRNIKILSVDPNPILSKNNNLFFINLGIHKKKIFNYISPNYIPSNIKDKKLLEITSKLKPDFIILNLGGGVQEILGMYLKKNLNIKTKIICTGGAISFFTKDQAPINQILDKLFLGWLIRILFNPIVFLPRYLKSFKLFKIVLKEKITVK
jgi:N-acetylglucosaminyldiphosphoundecaprenol N-acetyl-beta-D-mannosaminyltransferase